MSAAYFRSLFEYNRWANRRILDAAAQVDEAAYFAPAEGLSFGSLHATLVHAVVAELIWVARLLHELPPEGLRDARITHVTATTVLPSFESVRARYAVEETKQQAYFDALTDADFEQPVAYATQSGEQWMQPLDELMGHMFNHSTQFRSEASVRLSALGHSPGDLDLIIFLRQR
jgi:uncharacterized damage-inducible protein DinB